MSPVIVLLNIEVSVTLFQTSHRRLPHFEEPTFLCHGYNLARTKQLLSFRALRNETIGPGEKVFLTSFIYIKEIHIVSNNAA